MLQRAKRFSLAGQDPRKQHISQQISRVYMDKIEVEVIKMLTMDTM